MGKASLKNVPRSDQRRVARGVLHGLYLSLHCFSIHGEILISPTFSQESRFVRFLGETMRIRNAVRHATDLDGIVLAQGGSRRWLYSRRLICLIF